jgi:hypothetical protein
MGINKSKLKTKNPNYEKEYEEIMKSSPVKYNKTVQWVSKGDVFQKFSLYESYQPVKTSGSTTLIFNI